MDKHHKIISLQLHTKDKMSKLLKIIQFQNILPIFDIKLSRKTPLRAHSIESVTSIPDSGFVQLVKLMKPLEIVVNKSWVDGLSSTFHCIYLEV